MIKKTWNKIQKEKSEIFFIFGKFYKRILLNICKKKIQL
ncbi:hypothetical protein LEP1GSC077_4136 [Leptospira interrogans str. C10069]|uniref:Uncharacterized protein n=2 Tax=Leptospira interrogans TaxID=173 RepID=M7A5M6_LEPIR|nr:hypothetical protein G436_3726 [Leptospira interrogans serovar Hardjo str. Norma]EKO05449.1 hypothetical protein LEP1GSC077_4136 [Leptospira interrogans str. C10069]EKO94706.1 hypothetical protein LEP1GSC057_4555 [Leptospira interrogans str. Brem 329]EKR19535.1 hypothetical protein LEP1GSC019_0289 [Leptospira interrogans serovar Pyrogenes str. 2006006960]EMN64659.1 hypothetical protein LEP1GSC092_2928 [Leptospira interrogans serovar Pyrogenes str. R168]EMP06049.1 hypothetical protein LEP1GS